jgi:murein lipoprotein
MRKILLGISMVLVLALGMWGCATTSDLEKVQAQQKAIDMKADQAIQEAQAAKAAANEATMKADAAVKKAEERERIAEEKEKQADALFQKSMKK